jgi:Zn-dependent metalloprotease
MQDPTRGKGHLITAGMKYSAWSKLSKTHNLKGRIYPDRITKKIKCGFWQDNGGVHINSSIFNKFSYLAASGEEIRSEGLGRELLSKIYFKMLKEKILSSNASFTDFKAGLIAAAELVLENHDSRQDFMQTLSSAFEWIEL